MQIAFENVSHIYGKGSPFEKQALTDVSFSVPSGSYVAIIGQTGSGKSTLIQHLNGLLKPTTGQIRIGEWTLQAGTKVPPSFRKQVGVVFQYPEHQLFEETVAKDVAFGPLHTGCSPEEAEDRVRQALATVGLSYEEMKDRSPFQLSGGQMRRVAIAGVLAMEPSVLVLDEPTAGLDPAGRKAILEGIMQIHRERRLTTVLVTHSMEDAARYADWLIVMSEGRMVMQGSPVEVFAHQARLQELSLDIPETVSFLNHLNARLPADQRLPMDVYREEELVAAVARLLSATKGAVL